MNSAILVNVGNSQSDNNKDIVSVGKVDIDTDICYFWKKKCFY